MKQVTYFRTLWLIFLAVITFSLSSIAQRSGTDKNEAKKLAFKNMVDSQNFVFVAQSATPLRGRFLNLTSLYDVDISKDTLITYLPYYGRAYSAPIDPSKGALDFVSTNFSYAVTPHKKSGWDVLVKPKDNDAVQQLLFTIYDNGSASLNVTSVSRDAISFSGYIKKKGKK